MKLAVTTLVFCVAALLALGMVMLYSSSMVKDGARFLVLQLLWGAVGLVASVVMALLDYRQLKRFWWALLALAFVLLVMVLIPGLGSVHGHARRWFSHGRLNFQPSEFAKVALIVALAWYGEHYQRQMRTWKRGILVPAVVIGLMAGLFFKEPDVGNALLLAAVAGIVLLLAGIRLSYFLPPVLAGSLAVGLFLYHNPMRSERIYSWLHLEQTKKGKGQQAYEAMLALGSGGLSGKGLGDGRQKLGFVPQQHTDFILSIIGEELGLLATLMIVAGFVGFLISGLYISWHAPDQFGFLLGSGICFLIALQAFINIGVVTSALPNKGLPLPFISYGGSNLLMMLGCVGILLSIARRARTTDPLAQVPAQGDDGSAFRSRSNPFKAAKAQRQQRSANAAGFSRPGWGFPARFA